ncbi:MAG: ATP-binding protein, partial [Spirochaetaceae bacterium]|nr:ATP-binding protein [Spirochaetaceae bacterium]
NAVIKRKSVFLFGPRQTGKSFFLRKTYPDAVYYDLLKSDLLFRLTANPSLLREELTASNEKKLVIIDEIQKLPVLLNEVHYLIENHDIRFILTGSSARKLKYGAANLLGGRALTKHLFPLTTREIPEYKLERIINFGSLPAFYTSPEPYEDLESYVGTYLQQEIVAEGVVRKLEHFTRFLQLAALCDTEMLNYSNIGSDLGMPAKTIREYFHILEDTLIGSVLQPFTETIKRKAISTAKFYFFDIGVSNILAQRSQIKLKTELFGKAFEHFIFLELTAYLHYSGSRDRLSFWRSKSGYEVDFLIGDEIAIEVKGTDKVSAKHLKGLKALSEDISLKHKIVVSLDPAPRKMGNIRIYPYRLFLEKLWNNTLIQDN